MKTPPMHWRRWPVLAMLSVPRHSPRSTSTNVKREPIRPIYIEILSRVSESENSMRLYGWVPTFVSNLYSAHNNEAL